jgi:hypothetical protein
MDPVYGLAYFSCFSEGILRDFRVSKISASIASLKSKSPLLRLMTSGHLLFFLAEMVKLVIESFLHREFL